MTPRHHGVCMTDLTNSCTCDISLPHRSRKLIYNPNSNPLPILVRKEGKVPQRDVPFLIV